jgi:hypothetical protein
MQARQEPGMSTRDLAGGTTAEPEILDDGRDRGETPVGVDDPVVPPQAAREPDHEREPEVGTATDTGDDDTLLPADEDAGFQRRWEGLQAGFVDEQRRTVEQADELVAQVMQRLAEGFAAERERLEQQWGRGEDVSTEDLRVALQRYRAFFRRLLSA